MSVNQIETVIECLTQAIDGLTTIIDENDRDVLEPIGRALAILRSERKAMKGDIEAMEARWSKDWKR